jgi:hypothetical protein
MLQEKIDQRFQDAAAGGIGVDLLILGDQRVDFLRVLRADVKMNVHLLGFGLYV